MTPAPARHAHPHAGHHTLHPHTRPASRRRDAHTASPTTDHSPADRPVGADAPAPPPQASTRLQLLRVHRVLIGVVVTGAVIIAGIGFTGSYTAVRELATAKGFGTFSHLFPIGIDAGICVLLALDLLLTFIRTPYPLLRPTAWLLTSATITFNAAAAWPDPLGAGMHAVIPVLFVVCVEAARHAIGRIADITADQHMEGIRPTRWLLSPIRTFLLWRRMKLWELRSYQQAITLEQQRLVYQARLRSRFGRAWRRTAPVESLIPLRLARYGIPLAQTAPAGLAATGINTTPHSPTTPQPTPHTTTPASQSGTTAAAQTDDHTTTAAETADTPTDSATARTPQPADAAPSPHRHDTAPTKKRAPDPTDQATRPPGPPPPGLTPADRYYLAWKDFQHHHPHQPDANELSHHLARNKILDRNDRPIKPKTLARYLLQFRIYDIWARHRATTPTPCLDTVTQDLTQHGITAQYGKPLHPTDLEKHLKRFQHRWHTLNPHNHHHPPTAAAGRARSADHPSGHAPQDHTAAEPGRRHPQTPRHAERPPDRPP